MPQVVEFLGYVPWAAPAIFGEWLVMARRANGLSRKRLAKRLEVDESTVFRWERGYGRPCSRLLARVKAVLLSDGFGGSGCQRDGESPFRQRDQHAADSVALLS